MKTLVLWGEAPLAGAKARAADGARVLLFGRSAAEGDGTLRAADLGPGAARILGAVTEWASALGERPGTGERRFAELFAWNEVPLWPYLHRFFLSPQSASGQWVRLAESFSFLFETELPDEVEAVGLGADETTLLERCCTARGVLFQGESKKRAARSAARPEPLGLRERLRGWRGAFGADKPKATPGALVFVPPEAGPTEVGEAFQRLLRVAREDMMLEGFVVGGEGEKGAIAFLDAPARAAVSDAEAAFTRALDELKDAPSTAAAFCHEGVSFSDLAVEADLAALLKRVLPAAVRRAEGLRAVLRAVKAKALCAAADDALALRAARLEDIPAIPFAEAKDGPRVLLALDRAARGAGMVG